MSRQYSKKNVSAYSWPWPLPNLPCVSVHVIRWFLVRSTSKYSLMSLLIWAFGHQAPPFFSCRILRTSPTQFFFLLIMSLLTFGKLNYTSLSNSPRPHSISNQIGCNSNYSNNVCREEVIYIRPIQKMSLRYLAWKYISNIFYFLKNCPWLSKGPIWPTLPIYFKTCVWIK